VHGSSTLDYDAVPASIADAAVTPGDPAYGRLTSTYFRGGAPGIVLLPRTVEQVVDAVDFAGRHLHLPLGIRSGGHGLGGRSTNDGGIVIDLRHLNGIHVLDPAVQLVRIGPGARWRDVAAALQPHGWALSSGDSGAVGVGGLATSGGIGLLARAHGLTIDRLVAAHVVLADGSVVVADEHEHRELFWAVRGAGRTSASSSPSTSWSTRSIKSAWPC
jgi:FAD/FMN-containing dehydrogenase